MGLSAGFSPFFNGKRFAAKTDQATSLFSVPSSALLRMI